MRIRSILREPLLHFFVLGGLLFLLPGTQAPSGDEWIVITADRIAQLEATFDQMWERPPTKAETVELVDAYVVEEVYVREARRIGLDRGDPVVRRHLRQKMEFLSQDEEQEEAPSDDALAAFLKTNGDRYRLDPEIELKQIFFDPALRGNETRAQALATLETLRARGETARLEELGDDFILPKINPPKRKREIERLFGGAFTEQVFGLPEQAWHGPLESSLGLHVVLVSAKIDSRIPGLSEIRRTVERDFLVDRQETRSAALYEELAEHYRVDIQWPDASESSSEEAAN